MATEYWGHIVFTKNTEFGRANTIDPLVRLLNSPVSNQLHSLTVLPRQCIATFGLRKQSGDYETDYKEFIRQIEAVWSGATEVVDVSGRVVGYAYPSVV